MESTFCHLAEYGVYYAMGEDNDARSVGPCSDARTHPTISIDEYTDSSEIKKLRSDLNEGIKNHNCERCWFQESLGKESLRSSAKTWFAKKEISQLKFPAFAEVRFSNICNFKCRMCGSHTSSAIAAEELREKISEDPVLRYVGDSETFVLDQIKKHAENLKFITFSGGEPMLQWQHWDLLNYLIENNLKPELLYYTNGSTLNFKKQNVLEKWKHFDRVTVRISIDSHNERAAYWRSGTNWELIKENIKQIQSTPNITLFYIVTVCWTNAFSILEMIKEIRLLNPYANFALNLVQHDLFSLQVMNQKGKEVIRDAFIAARDQLKISQFDSLIKYMFMEDLSHRLPDAINQLRKIDEIRNENFFETFPEFIDIIEERE